MPDNYDFYNLQEQRRYPLDDLATGTADDGTRIEDNILADLQIRFPRTAGEYAFVAGINVTANLVTVTILAAVSPDTTGDFVPLAAVSLTQPVMQNQHYDLQPMYPGVGGWIVFGAGITQPFVGRFSTPQQGLLASRCARSYRVLPVPSIGKQFRNTTLSGLVTIKGGTDVQATKQSVMIDGQLRDALVLSLVQQIANRNVLEIYNSPCEPRPESGNCQKPGIQYINGVAPDCNGNINIRFPGLAAGPYASCGPGITLEQSLGLSQVCPPPLSPPHVPQYGNLCSAADSSASLASAEEPRPSGGYVPPLSSSLSLSSAFQPCVELPYCNDFHHGDAGFAVQIGQFVREHAVAPGETCRGHAYSLSSASAGSGSLGDYTYVYSASGGYSRNISVIEPCGVDAAGKQATVDLQLTDQLVKRNGGIVLNYQIAPGAGLAGAPLITYFMALVNLDSGCLQLLRFNGAGYVTEFSSGVLPLGLSDWYRLTAVTTRLSETQVSIRVNLISLSNPAFPATSFTVSTNNFLPGIGAFGVGANNAWTRFSLFAVEDTP